MSKRKDYISWKKYFMDMALLSAQRSKDPNTQVGCVIVDEDNRVISIGYNGFPNGCSDDKFPWNKGEGLDNKMLYVCHAELNAIMNGYIKLHNCILYTSLFPCNECAKLIIQSGIKKIYYKDIKKDKLSTKASKIMFKSSGVKYKKYKDLSI